MEIHNVSILSRVNTSQSNGIEAMWHMESRLRVPVQMESRLSVPVQDGIQTLKSTGIAIDTRGTWSIPREKNHVIR